MNEYNHKIFERMAALLLSLANLAECAGARCLPVRCLVLWILRPAEAVARAYAIEVAGSPILLEGFRWTDDMPDCQRSDETADGALSLARDFRALAAVFLWLAQWARLATSNALRCLILLQPSVVAERLPSLTALFSRRIDTS